MIAHKMRQKKSKPSFLSILALMALLSAIAYAQSSPITLNYGEAAAQWEQALPIGNGRLGAMVFGDVSNERVQFNEDTFWAGSPYQPNTISAANYLQKARDFVFQGQPEEAQKLIDEQMMANPLRQASYQPVGDVLIDFTDHENADDYCRELDISNAVATVSYKIGDVEYKREYFSSFADNVIVIYLSCNSSSALNFTASLKTPQSRVEYTSPDNNSVAMKVVSPDFQTISGLVECYNVLNINSKGGNTKASEGKIVVSDADEAVIILSSATNFKNYNDITNDAVFIAKDYLNRSKEKSFEQLKSAHIKEYKKLFDRVTIDFNPTIKPQDYTDQRLKNFSKSNDIGLLASFFQFGRYLLISSSIPGSQPANLQGIWNDKVNPPWESKYTVNINTQMNYWIAEPANLAECHQPLFKLVEEISQTGIETARKFYDSQGWVCHHNTDIWRATAPVNSARDGFWQCGGAWLAMHLWYHYEYTLDEEFLAIIYPIIKEATKFFLDSMVLDLRYNWLVTVPSLSPENVHSPSVSICAAPAIDSQILRDLFNSCITAADILDVDLEFKRVLTDKITYIPVIEIGSAGQIQEWMEDIDLEVPDTKHRHLSHLYALFPSTQIDIVDTPELAEAAKVSLELRGDEGTGWSKAWKVNLWARLGEAERAYKLLSSLISDNTYPNMFTSHPPFQIDANFGAVRGLCEMFLQSKVIFGSEQNEAIITLLPALPKQIPNGRITGLRAKGGFTVDLNWADGLLQEAVITSKKGNLLTVRYGDREVSDSTFSDYEYKFDQHLIRY